MSEFILYKKEGEVTNEKVLSKALESLKDGKYLVTFKSIKKRTLPQNAYYWGVVVPMVKDGLRNIGYNDVKTNDDAHEVLKHLFLKKNVVNHNTGEVVATIAGSTADLKTVEFNVFLEDVWQWASEYLSLVIPKPNEQAVMFAKYDYDLKTTIVE